jgi:predicted GNAT family acetyltransferase
MGKAYPVHLMALQLDRYDSVDAFLHRAGAYLEAREAEHNLIFGITSGLRGGWEGRYSGPPYLAVVADGDAVAGAALQTPPFNLVLAEVEPRVARVVAADRAAVESELPGVLGPPAAVRAFSEAWTEATGRPAQPGMRQRIFRLTQVRPPRPASGRARPAKVSDAALVQRWLIAFQRDVWGPDADISQAERIARQWIEGGPDRTLYLWEDEGHPVSMAGASGPTPHGIRIGAVYTPHELRGRGYASNVTAAVSRAQLDAGRQFCFLFTDLANPTSNKIYQAIGYEPITDVDEYRFAEG